MHRRSRSNYSEDRFSGQQRDFSRSGSPRRDHSSSDYQSDLGRDRSRSSQWSPNSDYNRSESRGASRYGTSETYRGQGRDLHYDETGRGYGDSYRNPGDYDDRSHRYSGRGDSYEVSRNYEGGRGSGSSYGNTYESGRGYDMDRSRGSYSDDQGYARGSRDYGSREGYRSSERSGRFSQDDSRVNRPLRGRGQDWNENDRNYQDESERDQYRDTDRY